ncbi:uncharacterized protein LOC142603224 [Balearica regulorum gibbericeps]|uniref:uncharacterized protein LOC142603224 n=1 Tax=Balearica regulorum gibbericeps TaxID=100784 RepID=UPI003F61AEBF
MSQSPAVPHQPYKLSAQPLAPDYCSSSSSSSVLVRVRGSMAPTHRLLLVFLLLVALHARAARAAPWRAQGADEDANNGASRLDVDLEPLEHPGAVPAGEGDPASRLASRSEAPADRMVTDVPEGRTFPAPRLDAVPQAGWHHRGPPRARYHQPEGGKKRPEPSPLLKKMLDEVERRHETDREAVKKLLFPDGSSGSLPVPPDEAQAMQGAGTPVLSESGEDHQASRYDFIRADSDVDRKRIASADRPQRTAGVLCPQDVRRRCMIGTAAGVIAVPVIIVVCCIVIRWQRKKIKE